MPVVALNTLYKELIKGHDFETRNIFLYGLKSIREAFALLCLRPLTTTTTTTQPTPPTPPTTQKVLCTFAFAPRPPPPPPPTTTPPNHSPPHHPTTHPPIVIATDVYSVWSYMLIHLRQKEGLRVFERRRITYCINSTGLKGKHSGADGRPETKVLGNCSRKDCQQ